LKFLVTGATGFLGWRSTVLLRERGHDVIAVARPGGRRRAHVGDLDVVMADAGGPEVRELAAGCDAVLHFAGVPDPARARSDPARAIRENVGTTLNLLEAAAAHDAGLIYPSTLRAAAEPPPDEYALSKRLGEEVCRLHRARATVVRLTSVYGPGQVAQEGATGAIAVFTAAALAGEPIRILGSPERTRDFVLVDDLVPVFERISAEQLWNDTFTLASGRATTLRDAAELVRETVGKEARIEAGVDARLAPGENESYVGRPDPRLRLDARPVEDGIALYVDWLRRHPASQGRTGA
jgi:UDP-glucose 4-epimerase